jgi:hypothetical protein
MRKIGQSGHPDPVEGSDAHRSVALFRVSAGAKRRDTKTKKFFFQKKGFFSSIPFSNNGNGQTFDSVRIYLILAFKKKFQTVHNLRCYIRVARFSWYKIPKRIEIYQMTTKYSKWL